MASKPAFAPERRAPTGQPKAAEPAALESELPGVEDECRCRDGEASNRLYCRSSSGTVHRRKGPWPLQCFNAAVRNLNADAD
jgi:hypothetical protein